MFFFKDAVDDKNIIEDKTIFRLNNNFSSKLIKIKILPVMMKETKEQVEVTNVKILEDRNYSVDAVMVRIMKSRKIFSHKELVLETITQFKSTGKFIPTNDIIKKRIESLIDREYLERSGNDGTEYTYMP